MTMPEFEPVAYGVLEGRDIKSCDFGYIAAWPQACHEHINEAIAEHNIEGASTWKVVEFFTQDQLKQAYAAGQASKQEIISAQTRKMGMPKFEQAKEDWMAHDDWQYADRDACWKFFYSAGQSDGKAIPMKYRRMEFNAQLQAELVAAMEERRNNRRLKAVRVD